MAAPEGPGARSDAVRVGQSDGRPLVQVSSGSAAEPGPEAAAGGGAGLRRRRGLRWCAVLALALVAALTVHSQVVRARWSVGAAVLKDDGTVAVTLADRKTPLRVRRVVVEGDGVDAPVAGALTDEVAAAQSRGLAPVHDAARLLSTGSHTFLVGVRPTCPAVSPPSVVRVRLDVEVAGVPHSTVRPLSATDRDRLVCVPLTVRAGLSPLPQTAGRVTLQITAYAGTATPPAGFRELSWAGYQVAGVAAVVPLALGWAAPGGSVVFDAVISPDCGAPSGSGLAAVFGDRWLPVPVTAVAAERVQALRSACPAR